MLSSISVPPGPTEPTYSRAAWASPACLVEPAGAFLEALLAGDQAKALLVATEALEQGLGHVHEHVIGPAIVDLGRLWQEDRISVADEHLATALAESTLAALYPRFAWPVGGPTAILVAPAPERHQLGARMVADMLALDGWQTAFLGADVTAPAVAEIAASRRCRLVGLSITMSEHRSGARATIEAVRRAAPGVRVLVGGHAVHGLTDPTLLGADALASSSTEAARVARPWLR